MRRTRSWLNRMVRENQVEVEWETANTVQVRWFHSNRRSMVWVVQS